MNCMASTFLLMVAVVLAADAGTGSHTVAHRFRNGRQDGINDQDIPVVINGAIVTSRSNNQFSGLARVYSLLSGTPYTQCTGSLVSVRYVLTAGHCIMKSSILAYFRLKYSSFQVVLGDLMATATETGEQTITGTGVPYPLYPSTLSAIDPTDIGLIRLDQDATLSSTVQLMSLPSSGYTPTDGSEATVAGWGRYQEGGTGSASAFLRYGTVKVNSDKFSCTAKSSTKQICFGPLTTASSVGQTSCNGDSGGPIMQQVNGNWVVIATVSYGTTNCPLTSASGGVAVAAYLDWINKKISSSG